MRQIGTIVGMLAVVAVADADTVKGELSFNSKGIGKVSECKSGRILTLGVDDVQSIPSPGRAVLEALLPWQDTGPSRDTWRRNERGSSWNRVDSSIAERGCAERWALQRGAA